MFLGIRMDWRGWWASRYKLRMFFIPFFSPDFLPHFLMEDTKISEEKAVGAGGKRKTRSG